MSKSEMDYIAKSTEEIKDLMIKANMLNDAIDDTLKIIKRREENLKSSSPDVFKEEALITFDVDDKYRIDTDRMTQFINMAIGDIRQKPNLKTVRACFNEDIEMQIQIVVTSEDQHKTTFWNPTLTEKVI